MTLPFILFILPFFLSTLTTIHPSLFHFSTNPLLLYPSIPPLLSLFPTLTLTLPTLPISSIPNPTTYPFLLLLFNSSLYTSYPLLFHISLLLSPFFLILFYLISFLLLFFIPSPPFFLPLLLFLLFLP